jgi:glycosyltransferase involved in cell wall biosynthesis
MRVALVTSGLASAHEVAALARSLTRDGTGVDVLGPGTRGWGEGPYDVVHAHGSRALPALLTLGWHSPGRVATADGAAALWPRRRMLEAADRIICRSRGEAARLGRHAPSLTRRIRVVPVAIDTEAVRRAVGFDTGRQVVLCVDRLDREARLDRAVAALAALGDDFELAIIGTGPAARGLRRCAEELEVRDRVRFLGATGTADLHRWLVSAVAVVALGRRPAPGSLLLSALAAGTPVVASDVPAHRDALEPLRGGGATLLVPEASPLMVADALAEVAERRLVEAPLLAVATPEQVAAETLAIYEEATRRRPSATPVAATAAERAL